MSAAASTRPALRAAPWAAALATAVLAVAMWARPRPAQQAALDTPLPPFSGQDAVTGAPVSLQDLAGRPWVASFIFTRCQGPCPLVSSRMAAVQERLPEGAALVTFTVDPDYDSDAVLKDYAARFGAVPGRWRFVRLTTEALYKLMYEGFRLSLGRAPAAEEGFQIIHSTRLARVDGKGRVAGFYDSNDPASVERLIEDLRRSL